MDAQHKCPTCGQALAVNAPAGLCPECLIKVGLGTGVDIGPETESGAVRPAFVPPTVADLGPLFPQLEVLELIGHGGMGAVYKARQTQLGRFVALKILPPGIGSDPAFAERFSREARALAQLNHPGIVTIYDFGIVSRPQAPAAPESEPGGATLGSQPLYYFLMEYVDGVNLGQLIRAGRISAREALAIVPQICDALQFAHDQGIVHRDIKPENILLDRRGRVKVADFGLARMMEPVAQASSPGGGLPAARPSTPVSSPTEPTEAGKVLGTPPYMSPEQIQSPGEVDHRTDIYALGVVFYQMLTGELPGKQLEPPSRKVQIDVRLDEVVLRALEAKPELRYQQASVLKTQVETIAATSGNSLCEAAHTEASPIEKRKHDRPRRSPRRWRWLATGGAVLAGLWVLSVLMHSGRTSVLAEFDEQVFLVDAAAVNQLPEVTPFVSGTNSPWLRVNLSREMFLRLRAQARARDNPYLRQTREVSAWPRGAAVNWTFTEPGYLASGGTSAFASGFLGVRRRGENLEARVERVIGGNFAAHPNQSRFDSSPAENRFETKFLYEGPAPLTNVLAFLVPLPAGQAEGNTNFLLFALQVACGEVMPAPQLWSYGTNGIGVCYAHDGTNVYYALYSKGADSFSCGNRGDGWSRTWANYGTLTFGDGRVYPFLHESARSGYLNIGAQSYNLRDGTLLVLDENGRVEQHPVFPDLTTVRDLDALARLVELNPEIAKQTKDSGPVVKQAGEDLAENPTRALSGQGSAERRVPPPATAEGLAQWPDGSEARQELKPGNLPMAYSFGPALIRVIEAPDTGTNRFLNLDTGQLLTPPKEIRALFSQPYGKRVSWEQNGDARADKMREWLRSTGANLMLSDPAYGLERLELREGVAFVPNVFSNNDAVPFGFDQADPTYLATRLNASLVGVQRSGISIPLLQPGFDRKSNTRFDTFCFRTRAGTVGMLQILNPEDNPRGVRVRYKVVRSQAVESGAGPAPEVRDPSVLQWEVGLVASPAGASADSASDLPFGRVIERTLYDYKSGKDWLLNLQTGETFSHPPGSDWEKNPARVWEWAHRHGVHITGLPVVSQQALYGFEMKVALMQGTNLAFDAVTPAQVDAALRGPLTPMSSHNGGPSLFQLSGLDWQQLYAFQTDDGLTGVLQVVGMTKEPAGVKIRYKLLDNGDKNNSSGKGELRE